MNHDSVAGQPVLRPRRKTAAYRVAGFAAALAVAVGVADLIRTRRALDRVGSEAASSVRQLADSERRVRELTTQVETLGRRESPAAPTAPPLPLTAQVFQLIEVRSDEGGPPDNRVTLSGAHSWVVLLVDLDTPPTSNQYRASIQTSGGRSVWAADSLTASLIDTLAVAVPPDLLANSDYVLALDEKTAAANAWHPAGRYTFRVVSR